MKITIYILERYKGKTLIQYWLFNDYERLRTFLTFCYQQDNKECRSYKYQVKTSYPHDRE